MLWRRRRRRPFASSWSTTYPLPDFDPPAGWPAPRTPDVRIRVVPNESVFPGPLDAHLGELVQDLVEAGADYGVSVELDTSDRSRSREYRSGASPIEVVAIVFLTKLADRALDRFAGKCVDAAVAWVLRHRRTDSPEPIKVVLYGPDGEPMRTIDVPQDGGEPVERPR